MTATAQLLKDHEIKTGWPFVSFGDLIAYSLLVISTSVLFLLVICLFVLSIMK